MTKGLAIAKASSKGPRIITWPRRAFCNEARSKIRIVAQAGETRDGQARCSGTQKTQSFGDTDGEPNKSHALGADESSDDQWIHQRAQLPGTLRSGVADTEREHLAKTTAIENEAGEIARSAEGGEQAEDLPNELACDGGPNALSQKRQREAGYERERLPGELDLGDGLKVQSAFEFPGDRAGEANDRDRQHASPEMREQTRRCETSA